MALSAIQVALKADILASADPLVIAANAAPRNETELARLYNLVAVPQFVVWRSRVTRREILQNGFDWTRLDNLSVGKARVWSDIFVDGVIDPSKPNVRTGIESVWIGTAPDLAVRAAVYVHCKRDATRCERLLCTGTGSTAVPGLLGAWEGRITPQQVADAMGD